MESIPVASNFGESRGSPIIINRVTGKAYVLTTAGIVVEITGNVTPQLFGAVGDGVVDDTEALQDAIDYVKTNGLELHIPPGTYRTGPLNTYGGTVAWALSGAGSDLVTFVHVDGNGTLIHGASTGSAVPYELEGFTVDCKHSVYAHVSANHAISIADTSGVRIKRVKVRDYKGAGILVFGSTPNTYSDNKVIDCDADGGTVGIMLADLNDSHIIDCRATNVDGSPGYGLELKNDCRYCSITNGFADGCVSGLAFGNDSGASGVKLSRVNGMVVRNPTAAGTGFLLAYAENNKIDNLVIDMGSTGNNAVDFQNTSFGNAVSVVVKNLAAAKGAVRIRSGGVNNSVVVETLDNINSTGVAAIFDSGSNDNSVLLRMCLNPTIPANGARALVSDSSTGQDNYFEYQGYLRSEVATGTFTCSPIIPCTEINSSGGAVTATLGSGTTIGQQKMFVMTQASNSSTLSVTNHVTSDPEVFTFDAVDEALLLQWTGTEWMTVHAQDVTT